MTDDPQSQATPARPPHLDEPDESPADHTHYSDDRTHYSDDRTHYSDDRTHYSGSPSSEPAGHQSGYQSIPLAPNPAWSPAPSWQPISQATPPGGTDPGSLRPPITEQSSGAWAPSNWHLPEDRFTVPDEVVETVRRQVSVTRLLSWALAVVIVAVMAGVVYVRYIRVPPEDLDTRVPETAISSAQVQIVSGEEAVRLYLTALAAGDVEKALSYGPTGGSGADTLITNETYATTHKAAPITAITVPAADANATTIPASFKVGPTQVNTSFAVVKQDNGSWQLARTSTTFQLRGTQVGAIPLRLNGVPVSWDTPMELVPGTYTLSTGLPFVAFPDSTTLQIQSLNYTGLTTHTVAPNLTDEGRRVLIDAVTTSIANCAARKELQPANCPNSLSSPGGALVPSSIVWTVVGDPLADARPVLSSTDQSQATMNLTVVMTISGRLESGGQINAQEHAFPTTVTADMKVTTAEQVAPKWK